MFNLRFSLMMNFFVDMAGGIGQFIGRLLYYTIICGVSRIADICQIIFRKFAGIADTGLNFNGEDTTGDFVLTLIQTDIVQNLFISLSILAVIILLIATFVGTIKAEFAKDGNNNKRKVIKNAFRGLANFVLVPVICLFGIYMGNALLKAIDGATSPGNATSLSQQIFVIGGYNANRARLTENDNYDSLNNRYESGSDSFGALLTGQTEYNGSRAGVGNFGIFFDDENLATGLRAAEKIDKCFATGYTVTVTSDLKAEQTTLIFNKLNTWYGGHFYENVTVDKLVPDTNNSNSFKTKSVNVYQNKSSLNLIILNNH